MYNHYVAIIVDVLVRKNVKLVFCDMSCLKINFYLIFWETKASEKENWECEIEFL